MVFQSLQPSDVMTADPGEKSVEKPPELAAVGLG
jgi:hypothetical protein